MRFARFATPRSVPAVSKRFTKRNEITMLTIVRSSAPMISNFMKVGAKSGGIETSP